MIAAAVVIVVLRALAHVIASGDTTRVTDLATVLALCSAAAGATAAILCWMYARLCEEPRRSVWLGLALSVYTFVAIPAATIGATTRWDEAAVGNIRLFAHLVFVALVFLVAAAPPMPRWCTRLSGLLVLLAVITALVWLGETYPAGCLAVTTSPVARWGLTAFWPVGPLLVMGIGLCQRSDPLYKIGLGLEIVAVAHAFRVSQGGPSVPLDLSFSLVRLSGILLLLSTALMVTRHYLSSANRARTEQQAQLHEVQSRLLQFRTRDHELRTGLAGLAGATKHVHAAGESAPLQHAIATELRRLNAMMRQSDPRALAGGESSMQRYCLNELLRDQVALRRSQGMDIQLDAAPELFVVGSASAMAQVVSNVLANCERHAPGSPVHIRAEELDTRVRVRITDFGPGVPEGLERAIFQLGTRGPHSGGQGIGLHVCHQLIQEAAGSIFVAHNPLGQRGCTVVVELPSARVARAPLPRTS